MTNTRNAILVFLLLAVLAIAACGTDTVDTGNKQAKVFRIGAVHPLTGEGAVYGLPVQRVTEQAVTDLNAKWQAEGKNQRLEVFFDDGKCNGKDGLSAAQNLVNIKGVKIIYGGTCSGETLGMAPFAEENKILVFSPLSSSPAVTEAGDFVFRNYPSDTAQVAAMVPFVKSKGYKTIALLSENTDYAQALRKSYLKQFPEAGIEVVADEVVPPNSKDVRTQVTKIKNANPDAVMLLPQTIPMGEVFVTQVFESGLKAQGLGNEVFGLEGGIKGYAEQAEGFYSPSAIFAKENSPEFAQLKAQTQCELGIYCATTYDGIFLLGEILERCGDKDTTCVRDALYATQGWQGKLSGETSIDSNGDVAGAFQVNQVKSGKLVKVA